ncbi:hypothetical protein JCM19237_321 [Photobacterium aphoticum]|uniref:Uncharacterized protein n=1 Tax=Photobacterium aphoticum TaxID=754436 RepID=A0A090QYI9_9GAMM|nr:hypothetical protein JCM19237_321 [Photobacterium aphoticum]
MNRVIRPTGDKPMLVAIEPARLHEFTATLSLCGLSFQVQEEKKKAKKTTANPSRRATSTQKNEAEPDVNQSEVTE